jgi:hypothetical protein
MAMKSYEREISRDIEKQEYEMYIDGEWVKSDSEDSITVVNPATEQAIAKVP